MCTYWAIQMKQLQVQKVLMIGTDLVAQVTQTKKGDLRPYYFSSHLLICAFE